MLQIPLANVADDGVDIDTVVQVASIRPEGAEAVPVDEVHLTGNLQPLGEDYLFQGDISGTFRSTCDRCLKPAELPFAVEAVWNFERDPKGAFEAAGIDFEEEVDLTDSAMCRPIVGEVIDLGPHLWEELALATPFKFLCHEDCPGLCVACGADLNQGDCGCPPEAIAVAEGETGVHALAGLAALLPELTAEQDPAKKKPGASN